MENRSNNHNGTGNGFFLGLFVGVCATLLFSTKKGREIVREMTDKGLQKFSDIEDSLDMELEEEEDNDYIAPEENEKTNPAQANKEVANSSEKETPPTVSKPSRTVKRFFRGMKKN